MNFLWCRHVVFSDVSFSCLSLNIFFFFFYSRGISCIGHLFFVIRFVLLFSVSVARVFVPDGPHIISFFCNLFG